MAKTKKEKAGSEDAAGKSPEGDGQTLRELRKAFGEGVVIGGEQIIEKPPEILKISPRFDLGTGGGLQKGTIVTMAGPAGCGKTTTALHIAKKWQQQGGNVYLLAVEHRIFPRDLLGIPGLIPDQPRFVVIKSTRGRILSAQDFLTIASTILKTETNVLVIVDSFSMLSDMSELSSDNFDRGAPAATNLSIGKFCRMMLSTIAENSNMLIGLAHVYTNIGGKKKWAVGLATKVNHSRATGLVCDWTEPIMAGEKQVGQTIHWKVERSFLQGWQPKFDSILRYGQGIDEIGEAVDLGCELGVIQKAGNWLAFPFADDQKVQGKEQAWTFFSENPEHFKTLQERLAYFTEPEAC